jgi:uncharacterized protein YndB with AHSA1/START domain
MPVDNPEQNSPGVSATTTPARKRGFLLRQIFTALAFIILGCLASVAMQPSDFRVTRMATINAPAPVVFGQVNDLHKWDTWSPWAKLDPQAKHTFEGPSSGKGAIFRWEGNDQIGEGKMTITESRPSDLIRIKIDFLKPFQATNTAEFTFHPEGSRTVVTWSMSGTNNFVGKAFCLFMNMDKMLGGDFEKGLAQMKSVAEAPPKE